MPKITLRFAGLLMVLFLMLQANCDASGRGCAPVSIKSSLPAQTDPVLLALSDAAIERTRHLVAYDPAYVVIDYPGGDVPPDRGVCTDVVIRSYRKLGIDLQQRVHEDMRSSFAQYPKRWGLPGPDKNIDHRRVPNLMTFFKRKGAALPISQNPRDYLPGDVVAWDLGGGTPHIGIVVADPSTDRERYRMVHNIGEGPRKEDVLFSWEIIGHYRYTGKE